MKKNNMVGNFLQHFRVSLLIGIGLTVLLAGCAGTTTTVEIPPQVDLKTWPVIGVVNFTAQSHGELAPAATQKFMMQMQGSQQGVRLLELGSREQLLKNLKRTEMDPETIKAVGTKYGVQAVLTGTLDISDARPSVKFSPDLTSASAKASVDGTLSAKMQETSTGATVWSNGAHGNWSVGGLTLGSSGLSNVGYNDPKDRYDEMLRDLTRVATDDFRPRYEKRRVK